MRKLTRPEIEACGSAMPKIMTFHDKLIGSRLRGVIGRPVSHPNDPPPLIFEQGTTLVTKYHDEGNPGDTEWRIVDREGRFYHSISIDDLIGHPVTGIGYFYDEDNDDRRTDDPLCEDQQRCLKPWAVKLFRLLVMRVGKHSDRQPAEVTAHTLIHYIAVHISRRLSLYESAGYYRIA